MVCVCQEFEIELEGSQTLRLLCYEKSCNKIKQNKEDGEMTDKIVAKGQIKVHTHTHTLVGGGGILDKVKVIYHLSLGKSQLITAVSLEVPFFCFDLSFHVDNKAASWLGGGAWV